MPPIVLLWLALLHSPQAALQPGAQGAAVQALQVELRALHDYSGPVDGIYGPATAKGVSQLERTAGFAVNGVAGPEVLVRIVDTVAGDAPVLKEGSQGPAVGDLQGLLQADGISCTADGVFGPQTAAAVRALQARRGITADGVVGPRTWQAIFARDYKVAPGDTLSGLAGRFSLPLAALVATNGGKAQLLAGQTLVMPYAGWSAQAAPVASTPAAGATQPASGASGGTGGGGGSPSAAAQPAKTGGGNTFIPAGSLAKWGSAGTPDISIVVLAQDAAAARALERGGLPSGMLLALPPALWKPGTASVLLATSSLPTQRPGALVWLGSGASATLGTLLAQGTKVIMAPRATPAQVQASASGGATFVVPVHGKSLTDLSALAQALHKAGYELVPPAGF